MRLEISVFFMIRENSYLTGFIDSDYAGDIASGKRTSGYIFFLGSGAISWCYKKQPIVSLSTIKADYIAIATCASQVV